MAVRRVVEVASRLWALMGASVALGSLARVNGDARIVVTVAAVVFPLRALGAAAALRRHHDRLAGLLLVLSVATPTYFAYVVNVPALVVGVALLVAPNVLQRPRLTQH